MLYSENRNFVLVAVPKTGSTAIQDLMMSIDPDITRNWVKTETGEWVKLSTHATARDIRNAMGKRAEGVQFIAFLRDPREILLSKYHFYRSGRAAREQGLFRFFRAQSEPFRPKVTARVVFAQMLPLALWSRVYPYKSSAHFVTDRNGDLLVDHIGLVQTLQDDVIRIFTKFGYSADDLQTRVRNRTEYDRKAAFDPTVDRVLAKRLPQDYALFNSVSGHGGAE